MKRWLLCLLFSAAAQADTQPVESFRHVLPIAQTGGEGLQRLVLPAEVHRGVARADLGDLRMFNARDELVPFAFASTRQHVDLKPSENSLPLFPLLAPTAAKPAASADLDLQIKQAGDGTLISLRTNATVLPDQRVTGWVADASRLAEPIAALSLNWTATPERQTGRLRVEGSDDLKVWSVIVADASVLELEHAGQRLTQKRVTFTPRKVRYLKLTWISDALPLKSLVAESQAATAPPESVQAMALGTAGDRAGEYVFDFGGRIPVEQISLKLPQANTVAPVRIFARSEMAKPWQPIASANFYRLHRDGAELFAPALAISTTAERYWKVVVDQRGGGLGGAMPTLEVQWQPRSIVFAARGEGPYRVAYGNAAAKPAQFALAELLPGYQPHSEYSLPLARAGEAVLQVVVVPGALQGFINRTSGKQVVLWLVLALGVAFLGWMAWRLNGQLAAPKQEKVD